MIRVDLTPFEVQVARIVAEARRAACRSDGVKDQKKSPRPGNEIDFEGMLGEMAFSKFANVRIDLDTKPRSGSYDVVFKGYRFDVKATRRVDVGNMLVQKPENDDVDCFVQVLLYSDSIAVISGWLYYHEARSAKYLGDLGHGPVYIVPRNALRPFRDIRERGAA